MIRSQLLARLLDAHPHLPRHAVETALNTILDEIAKSISQDHRVELRGFGSFSSKVREAHMGRNPRTGEPVEVASKRHMHFRASKQLNRPLTPS